MPDREKVIKGLGCCDIGIWNCKECPYFEANSGLDACHDKMHSDALELLKTGTDGDRIIEIIEQIRNGTVRRFVGDGFIITQEGG